MQREPSVVIASWVHAGWHETVIDSSGNVTATTTAIEGATVIQLGRPPDQHRNAMLACPCILNAWERVGRY